MRYILKIMLAIVLIILIGCASYILLSEDKISENKGDNIYISEKNVWKNKVVEKGLNLIYFRLEIRIERNNFW